ncbi:MAG: substrate-binding domain-containing protein, partial [Spirochaetes bacterium]|nr:substrate-binding domain-containing protein [Spirochaetota bacterium]
MNKKRITIGYITPRIYLGIQYSYFKGIVEGINDCNANLLCFSGASHGFFLESDRQANVMFDLVSSDIIDGMICWTSGLFYKDKYIFDIEKLLKLNRSIPIVCIGKPLHDFPTITTDNYQGIDQIIEHLAEVHKLKKIAFVRGPEYHLYAEERYQGYLKSMKKYNLSIDNRLITQPDEFIDETGVKAVKYYFDDMKLKTGKDIEAIVTTSDLISVGVVNELKKRGISIPNDIAVVGYNNREECIEITPQMTSVDLQFVETGKIAIKTILQMTENKKIPEFVYIPTKLVIRESCGCLNPALINSEKLLLSEFSSSSANLDLKLLTDNKNKIIKELSSYLLKYSDNIHFDKKWTIKLVNSLFNEIYSDSKNEFIGTLMMVVDEFLKDYNDIFIWQYLISKLYLLIFPLLNDKILFSKAESVFHNSRVRIFQKLDQSVIINKLNALSQQNIFPRISASIVTTFEVSKLLSLASQEFPKVGIEECYIAVYIDKFHPEYKSELIMGYNENGVIDLKNYDAIYNSYNFLPKDLFPFSKKHQLIVIPLFFQNYQTGYIIFKITNIDINLYYILASYLSSALQGSKLVKDLEKRAQELMKTYDNLKENQERLLAAEKMASLGRLTAGIAHEMNTPLAAARNAIDELGKLIEEYS